jgi:hypothetical protein
MTEATTDQTPLDMDLPVATKALNPERAFSMSMLVSAVRCTLTYVVLPFVTPFLGLAPGVGPVLGIAIGSVAIAANVFSLRRFWRTGHRLKRPITVLHVAVITLLLVLIAMDLNELVGNSGAV